MRPSATGRSWGDGHGTTRAHTIVDISLTEQWVRCSCEARVERTAHLTLEDAWDVHRGKPGLVTDRALRPYDPDALATDEEVGVFLDLTRDPDFVFEGY